MSDKGSSKSDTKSESSPGWQSAKVNTALEWHSPAVSKKNLDDAPLYADRSLTLKTGIENLNEQGNIFRLADEISNKAFSASRDLDSNQSSIKNHATLRSYESPRSQSYLLRRGFNRKIRMSMSEGKRKNQPTEYYSRITEKIIEFPVCSQSSTNFAEYISSRFGKLLIAMVGLPARGKSFIAMGIKRHLDWLGLQTQIFNAGNYRRNVSAEINIDSSSANFFKSSSKEGAMLRQKCAEEALNDAIAALRDPNMNLSVVIFDATNTTKQRRAWLLQQIEKANEEQFHETSIMNETEVTYEISTPSVFSFKEPVRIQLAFAESVLTDEKTVWDNVKESKLKSPDYAGMDPALAMKDFMDRIAAYKKVYEPVDNDEGVPYIRLTNAGEELLCHRCFGYSLGRVAWLMGSMRLTPRPILLARCGESANDNIGRIGGNPPLTQIGQLFADKLKGTISDWIETFSDVPVIWTSTLLRAQQTVKGLRGKCPIMSVHMLDEIKAGAAEGMTHAECYETHPQLMKARAENKLEVPFPGGGESYLDLFKRIEPLLLGLVAETKPVIVIAHLGVLRVIYSYLMGIEPRECPYLNIPMHCVLQLNPKGYSYDEWRHFPL